MIDTPPSAPDRNDTPAVFSDDMDAFLAWMATAAVQFNTLASAINRIAAGTAAAIPMTFSTTTTDADPGAGTLRLNNATQSSATMAYIDLADSTGATVTTLLDSMDDSTNTVKGHIRLQSAEDPDNWLLFELTAVTTATGYRKHTLTCVGYSAASPFANGEAILLLFTRAGDTGSQIFGLHSAPTVISGSTAAATFASLSASRGYELHVVAMQPVTTSDIPVVEVSTDNGATWLTSSGDYYNMVECFVEGSSSVGIDAYGMTTGIKLSQSSGVKNDAASAFTGVFHLPDVASGSGKTFHGSGSCKRNSGEVTTSRVSARITTTSAVDAIRVRFASGNIAAATLILFHKTRS